MIKVGIVGLGFMGKMHFGVYGTNPNSKVVAISDADIKKLKGDWSQIAGNIDDPGAKNVDLADISTYAEADELINDAEVELVDITLPTFLHARYTIKALQAGKDVICEKPMALNVRESEKVLKVARNSKGKLMVAHCIRFWPEYEQLRKIIKKRRFGRLYSLTLSRLSSTPVWGWQNWLQAGKLSGGAAIDLHIHDTDFVNWCFGLPKEVFSVGMSKTSGAIDHIVTSYMYTKNMQVTAEGGWAFPKTFGFEMSFRAIFEKGTVEYSSSKKPGMLMHMSTGRKMELKVDATDGYQREIDYFLKCIKNDKKPEIVTPRDASDAVKVVMAEIESVRRGKAVSIR